jgi:hypothetical protein
MCCTCLGAYRAVGTCTPLDTGAILTAGSFPHAPVVSLNRLDARYKVETYAYSHADMRLVARVSFLSVQAVRNSVLV